MKDTKEAIKKLTSRGATDCPTLRNKIVRAVVHISIVQLFGALMYKFGKKIFLQLERAPTGARSTMAASGPLMEVVLEKLIEIFENTPPELEISLKELLIYLDNEWCFYSTFNWGYRFKNDRFEFFEDAYKKTRKAKETERN